MPEFLVEITLTIPPDMSLEDKTAAYEDEHTRAVELADAGMLKRVWRVPGATKHVSLWSADNVTQVHDALITFPLWPYFTANVIPLADNRNDPGLHAARQHRPDYDLAFNHSKVRSNACPGQ